MMDTFLIRSRAGLRRVGVVLMASLLAAAVVAPSALAQRNNEEEEDNSNRQFTPDIGEAVLELQTQMNEAEDYRGALAGFERLLREEEPNPYELGIILLLAGNARYNLDDIPGAMRDWNRAINEGDLPLADRMNLMHNVAQLHFAEGEYRLAIAKMNEWIGLGGVTSDRDHFNLVAAYSELGEWQNALTHGRLAFEKGNPREKRHYDVLNFLYTELDMPVERAALLTEMVALFPQDRQVWNSIAALHAQAGRERKAFEIRKIMYLNGMLTTEREIINVVDYYSFFDVPYRGARILETEINAGRVERNQENLEHLARLYRQANEFDRAIPSLEAAARMSPDGGLYRDLGEAYYAEARLGEAETALTRALDRGGLGDDTGKIWVLLGNTRYEQDQLDTAIEAFESAQRFQDVRQEARDWQEFVEGEIRVAEDSAWFRVTVLMGQQRVMCERALSDIVIYRGLVESGEWDGPDCVTLVQRKDYSTAPDVVQAIQAFCLDFPESRRCPAGTNDGHIRNAELTPPAEGDAAEDGEAVPSEEAGAADAPASAGED